MDPIIDRPEIAFFDVETTVPTRHGQGFALLEFGAILVCPKKLEELESYSTLVRPSDLSLISSLSVRCNGITPEAVSDAPSFRDISDRVYNILHGRIWAGHNILRFDCARIREAYAEINKPAPEPKGAIDTLALLTQKFGRRAGDMKMATLASYFGLGKQTHRSLDDVRMNLEVVKYCATVLFLESSLPDIFTTNSWVSPNSTTRSRSNGKAPQEGTSANRMMPSSTLKFENNSMLSSATQRAGETYSILFPTTCIQGEQVQDFVQSKAPRLEPFDMGSLSNEIKSESLQPDITMEENPVPESTTISSAPLVSEGYADYVEPDEISIPYVNASFVPFYRGSQRMKISHKDVPLKLCCPYLKVRFGISTKFADHAGRPRLSFVVDTSPSLCRVLDACDNIAQRLSVDSGSSSEWKPVVIRKNGFLNSPTARVHIPTVINGDIAIYATEIYQKETSGNVQRLVFSRFDAAELDSLFVAGTYIDACFSLDPYDYQQNAGIRLVAKSLTIHSN